MAYRIPPDAAHHSPDPSAPPSRPPACRRKNHGLTAHGSDNTVSIIMNTSRIANPPPSDGTRQIARSALFVEVAERLRTRIFAHELAPGSWIDEQALTADYGISRTPLREALKVLAAEGLVTLRPGRGCQVTELFEKDLDELFPILALLEGRCASEAARRASDADLVELRGLHEALEACASSADIAGFFDVNQRFHQLVQTLAGNRWLAQMIQDARKVLKLTRFHSLFREGRLEESLDEHRRIVGAILSRDADAAQAEMENHLLQGRRAIGRLGGPAG